MLFEVENESSFCCLAVVLQPTISEVTEHKSIIGVRRRSIGKEPLGRHPWLEPIDLVLIDHGADCPVQNAGGTSPSDNYCHLPQSNDTAL
jgi:hypothetical protein